MSQRPSTTDNTQAVLVIACQLLTNNERLALVQLVTEQTSSGNPLGRFPASAATDLTTAVTALATNAAFVTAMATAGYT